MLQMYAQMGAKERTLHELTDILAVTGWKIENVRRAEGGLFAFITASPV